MQTSQWDGKWPETETDYPRKGERIRFVRTTRPGEGVVDYVWCGIEPVITLVDGSSVFPSFDKWERVPVEKEQG